MLAAATGGALSLNANTAITAGTSQGYTFGLVSLTGAGAIRSVGSVALTAPHVLTTNHSQRVVSGLKFSSLKTPAPDVVIDRHFIGLRKNAPAPTMGLYDPEFKLNYSVSLTIEVPRLGATDSPTSTNIRDAILMLTSYLRANSDAELITFLNNEP